LYEGLFGVGEDAVVGESGVEQAPSTSNAAMAGRTRVLIG
jgi:hypothetical protein